MNATSEINVVTGMELPVSKPANRTAASRRATRPSSTFAYLRRGLIVITGVTALTLAFAVRHHLQQMDEQMEMIRANLANPVVVLTR
ncbi:MAG TPA: hypothetical protein PKA41_07540 [Verrucomicrobiota bacterium]|nr:hypothetical protein [Verrucomicrobiota bacterium]